VVKAGPLEVRPGDRQAFVNDTLVPLTRRECQVLCALARRHDRVVTRPHMFRAVWGAPMPYGDRSIDVVVRRLRRKLEAADGRWIYIHTHFGIGYRLGVQPAPGGDDGG